MERPGEESDQLPGGGAGRAGARGRHRRRLPRDEDAEESAGVPGEEERGTGHQPDET